MRKCGKFLLIAILAIVLVATLAACNFGESSQSGQQGGGVKPGGDPVVEQAVPYDLELRALKGSSAFAKAVASEFDISRDVEAYIRLRQGNALIPGEKITLSLENVVEEDRAKLGGAFDGYITVEYTHQDKVLSGKFELHLLADTADRVAVNIDIGDGARLTGGDAKKTDVAGVWSVSLPLNEQYYYEDFVGTYKLFAPEGKALSHYTYGNGQTFGTGGTLTVTEGLTLTAVYSSSYVKVKFDLNANSAWWEGGQVPADPEDADVAPNSTVPRPASQNYTANAYTLVGWSLDPYGGTLWNFSSRLSAQTDARDTITLYGVWTERSAAVRFDLGGGTMVSTLPDSGLTDYSTLTPAIADPSYNDSGLVRALTVRGVKFGDKLDKYSVTMALTKDGEEVTFALVDLPKLITKGEMYTCSGLFVNEDRNEDWLANPVNAANVTVYTSWKLAGGDPDKEYYLATYNYTLKADNTYAITARDREALVLYIPAAHPDGKPVTEIADGAFSGMSEVTKVDFSDAVNLTEIGSSAFYACTALSEVVGDESLTKLAKVGSDAFYGTAWMNGKSSGEGDVTIGNVLVRYMGEDTAAIDLSGTEYKYIAEYALSGYKNVTTIALPSTIVRIDDNTLGIASLERVTAAAGIEYIGRKAFESSVMISGQSDHIVIGNVFYLADNAKAAADGGVVTIPKDVTVIAPGAFAQCAAVKELKFDGGEENITYIGARAFNGSGIEAADEDGFIIVNGILASYTGRAETVVVPDEVRVVAPYAFGKGVKNVVFRSTSSLERIENNAFTGASALETVAAYKDSGTFTAEPYAFADGSGYDAATASVKVYLTTALYDGMDTEVGALAWLNANGRVEESVTEHVELNADVFVHDYVASDEDGTFDQYDFAVAWGDTDIAEDLESAVVPDGISVTRDGITVAEDYVITLDTVLTGLRNAVIASGRPHEASGTLELKYGDNYTFELDYVIHAAIDGSTLELDDTYRRDGGRLLMYNTQSAFNTLGSMTFGYKTLKVGGKTGPAGAADAGSVPLNSSAVSVIGYQPNVGEYSGDNALKIVYNYYGREYTKTYDYVVRTPRVMGLQQVSAAVMPLGSSAADYNTDITFNVIYEDGRTVLRDLRSATVITVDGVNASALSTAEAGVHTAEIRYSETGSIPKTGTIVYAVELVAIDGLYTFSYNDADKTATITGVTSQRDFYVLPSVTVNPENDLTYQVVAIGDRAFAGSRLSKIYIPRGITVIGDGAFSGCANLTQVLGFEYNDDAANDSSLAFGDFRILSEQRVGEASVAILGIEDYALSEDVITIPHLGVYSGVISGFTEEVLGTFYDPDNTVVTADYTLNFTVDEAAVTAIADKLAGYDGIVRLPAVKAAEGDSLTVVDGFLALYNALAIKGLDVELFEDAPLGMDALYGRIEVEADALAEVEYTATGSVIFTGTLRANSGGIAYIPATVTNGESRVYTVTAIKTGTLGGVKDAEAIYLPSSVVAFEGGLDGVFGGVHSADIYMYTGSSLIRPHSSAAGTAKLPAGIEEIGNQAFMNCSLLDMDFYAALNLKTIGSEAFAGCTTLDKVCFGTGAQLTYIGYGAFMDSGVAEVDLGSTKVGEIEASAFDSCRSLGRLVLPAGTLKVIGARAFYGCTGLVDGTVKFVGSGSYITYIGESAFYGCTFSPGIVRGHEAADCHEADDAFYDKAGNAFEGI